MGTDIFLGSSMEPNWIG